LSVNLLSPELVERKQYLNMRKKLLRTSVGITLAVMFLTVLAGGYYVSIISEKPAAIAPYQDNSLQKSFQIALTKSQIYNIFLQRSNRLGYGLVQSAPNVAGVSYTGIKQAGKTITIDGVSDQFEQVSTVVNKITQTNAFSNVKKVFIQQQSQNKGTALIAFQLELTINDKK
jgi:hypothetical protein